MEKIIKTLLLAAGLVLFLSLTPDAQEKKNEGLPPAQVVVTEIGSGMIAPEKDFIGTVYYREVSDVAAEVEGLVEQMNFEEGKRVKKGSALVTLSSDLLEKTLRATEASHEQVLSDLDKARRDLKRAENLFQSELISEQTYDDRRFAVSGLEKKALSLGADVERLQVELGKKIVRAPFDGIVIKKHVDRGEWLSEGLPVATLANDSVVDIIADIPESVTPHIRTGMKVKAAAGGRQITGVVTALIPRGDVASRTFPVKIRALNTLSLIEGMEARVTLPTGPEEETFTVNRDALITVSGRTSVYAVSDTKAKMIPVEVVGYSGMTAGFRAEGIHEGTLVVLKGNERLRDGQDVLIKNSNQ